MISVKSSKTWSLIRWTTGFLGGQFSRSLSAHQLAQCSMLHQRLLCSQMEMEADAWMTWPWRGESTPWTWSRCCWDGKLDQRLFVEMPITPCQNTSFYTFFLCVIRSFNKPTLDKPPWQANYKNLLCKTVLQMFFIIYFFNLFCFFLVHTTFFAI